jgi:SAM-dependent methyltransferase
LDLGCGAGHYSAGLAKAGCECVAVDNNPDILAFARSIYGEAVDFRMGDLLSSRQEYEAQFDLVLSRHLSFPETDFHAVIRQMPTYLRPEGPRLVLFDLLVGDPWPPSEGIDAIDFDVGSQFGVFGTRTSRYSLLDQAIRIEEVYIVGQDSQSEASIYHQVRYLWPLPEKPILESMATVGMEIVDRRDEPVDIRGLRGVSFLVRCR